jgi:hypothetical protein
MADKLDLVREKARKPSLSERSHQLSLLRDVLSWFMASMRYQAAGPGRSIRVN